MEFRIKRWIAVGVLIVSHLWLLLVAFSGFNALQTKLENDRAASDPLYRAALRLAEVPPSEAEPVAAPGSDWQELRAAHGPVAANTVRLLTELRANRLGAAGDVCRALAWPRCDAQTLEAMKKSGLR